MSGFVRSAAVGLVQRKLLKARTRDLAWIQFVFQIRFDLDNPSVRSALQRVSRGLARH